LVRNIRDIEGALGDGVKRIYSSEMAAMKKLRRVDTTTQPAHANP
ncbi:MAG: N-acetylneuraminate synthase, partial [Anaerolineae bacterium]